MKASSCSVWKKENTSTYCTNTQIYNTPCSPGHPSAWLIFG